MRTVRRKSPEIFFTNIFLIFSLFSSSTESECRANSNSYETRFTIPGLNHNRYAEFGDINIGVLMSITNSTDSLGCTQIVRKETWILHAAEAIAYAVQRVNNNSFLPQNVTLGFVILDYCRNANIALAQALSFLPVKYVNVGPVKILRSNSLHFNGSTEPSSDAASFSHPTAESQQSSAPPSSAKTLNHYDVVGVVGTEASVSAVAVSNLFSVARVPVISYMATADELSDKRYHSYFMRLVPPDKYQVRAMLSFISDKGWSYISVIHGDTTYGDTAFDNIQRLAPTFGICIATWHRVNSKSNFVKIIDDLQRFQSAKVVILFIEPDTAMSLFGACRTAGVKGHFIWIGSDSISDRTTIRDMYQDEMYGAFMLMYYSKETPEFESYLRKLRPNSTSNPWFNSFWEIQAQCSFKAGNCSSVQSVANFEKLSTVSAISLVIDSVYTFAHGIHKLLSDLCPLDKGYKSRLCVRGDLLLKAMHNLSFEGVTGKIAFDKNGDFIGKYEIRQVSLKDKSSSVKKVSYHDNLVEIPVAYYEIFSGKISYTDTPIFWHHLKRKSGVAARPEQRAPESHHPVSMCSRSCVPGEYKIQLDVACCWECRRCRENEIVVKKNTSCKMCDMYTWPDPVTNFTTCISIPPSYPNLSNYLSGIEVGIAVAGIVFLCLVSAAYIYFREHRVIKASSRELSILQIVAIFIGYSTIILLQTKPTAAFCRITSFTYTVSFACLYSPLIVKAVRIYRIFANTSQPSRILRFTSPQSQILMSVIFIAVQILLWVTSYAIENPSIRLSQPVNTEKYVELTCDRTLPALVSFLTYNFILVFLCFLLAFKTRKLPDNFNESRFMSMCASFTLVMWLAFVPTYFSANLESIRVLLLSASLLLNHTVALAFLILPKIYAAICVTPEPFVIGRFQITGCKISENSNRIAPTAEST